MIALVVTHTFDMDGGVKIFKDDEWDMACYYMKKLYDNYLKNEIECESHIDYDNTFCYEKYGNAKVCWTDGDYTEWQILNVYNEL